MQRFFTALTLTCLMLTFFVSDAAHTMWNGDVDIAEKNITTDKDDADTQYDVMQNANILYLLAKSEYEANEAKIERGANVTTAKLMAATVSVYVSGTLSAPVAVSSLVSMLDLSASIDASTSLLDAYETAISKKYNEVEQFEILSMAYNNTYDIYIGVLAGHIGRPKSYLSTYIKNEYNRRQGIRHKDSTTPSDKHGIEGRKDWGNYDNSFPSYPCEGPCTESFMIPTSDHEIDCGGPDDPSISKVGGCRVKYYSCNHEHVTLHTPGPCVTQKWHQAWNRGPNGESVPVWGLVDCGEWTRMCFIHMGGHASPADPGNNNFNMKHTTQRSDNDDDNNQQLVDNSPNCDSCTTGGCSSCPTTTPTMHACGVHETTVSGDHSWIIPPCGDDTHGMSACQVTSAHSSRQASCSVTNSYGDYCTVSNYFDCQNHAHQFPTRVKCRRNACNEMLLSQYDSSDDL